MEMVVRVMGYLWAKVFTLFLFYPFEKMNEKFKHLTLNYSGSSLNICR
jgi:hypothetical protein